MAFSGKFDLPLRGICLYVLQVVSFLIIGMLVKTLAPYFAVTELLLVRFSFTLVVLLAVIGPNRGPSFFKSRYPIDHIIRTTCGMTALGLTFVALSGAFIANATAVILSGPILAVCLAFFVLLPIPLLLAADLAKDCKHQELLGLEELHLIRGRQGARRGIRRQILCPGPDFRGATSSGGP